MKREASHAISMGIGLLVLAGGGAFAAEYAGESFSAVPHARFAFGALGGKRQVLLDGAFVYHLAPVRDPERLKEAEKEGKGPGGWLIVVERPAADGKPAIPKRFRLEGIPECLERVDERTICAGTGNHLVLIDVSRPAEPRILEEIPIARREIDGASEVRRLGRSLLVAARRQGLLRIDLDGTARPGKVLTLKLPGFATGLDARDDLVAVATGGGVSLVRAAGEEMRVESSFDTHRHAELVRFAGTRLAVSSKEYVVLYDLADPLRPVELGEASIRDPFFFSHLKALSWRGDRLYAAANEGGLYVWDWKEPRDPKLLIQFSFWGSEGRIDEKGRLAYLESLGLEATPESAARMLPARENVRIMAVGMAVDGEQVYLVDDQGKLWVLEVRLDGEPSARCIARP